MDRPIIAFTGVCGAVEVASTATDLPAAAGEAARARDAGRTLTAMSHIGGTTAKDHKGTGDSATRSGRGAGVSGTSLRAMRDAPPGDGNRTVAAPAGAVSGRMVTVSVELAVNVDLDAVALESAVASEGRRAARELYRKVLAEVDRSAVAASGGVRQRVEHRWIATIVGRLRIGHSRVRIGGRTYCPLDDAIDLRPGEASPAIRALVRRLTGRRLSSGMIAEVLGEISGTPFSRHVIQRIVRAERDLASDREADERATSG